MSKQFWEQAEKEYAQYQMDGRTRFVTQSMTLRGEFETDYPGLECSIPENEKHLEFIPAIQFNFRGINIYAWKAYDYGSQSDAPVRKLGWYLCIPGETNRVLIVPPSRGELYRKCLQLYNEVRR